MEFDKVKDSGKREEFSTGSRRDSRDGKGRYDLLPPYAIYRLARHFENGAKKYGNHNWAKGQHLSRYLDSGTRHLFRFLAGDKDEDHAIAAVWNLLCLIETEKMIQDGVLPESLNDLFDWKNPTGVKKTASDKSLEAVKDRETLKND